MVTGAASIKRKQCQEEMDMQDAFFNAWKLPAGSHRCKTQQAEIAGVFALRSRIIGG